MSHEHIESLRKTIAVDRGVLLPGAANALAARIIADLGFKAHREGVVPDLAVRR